MELNVIANIYTDYTSKFGIPRQPGLVPSSIGRIVFQPEYRNPDALRGIDSFSHIWLIWQFSENVRETFSPTVRPPRLGGNVRMGVFATRSPFRPNNLGMSCVPLLKVEYNTPEGPVLTVSGADLMNGTPIYDIKPYVPYSDCKPEATEGFAPAPNPCLSVVFSGGCESGMPPEKLPVLKEVLALDPRPHYHDDGRIYGMNFAGKEIKFRVDGGTLTVLSILAE